MTNIASVIGWKFNHQEGMSTVENSITEFPGGIPSQADQDKWTAEYEKHLADTAYIEARQPLYPPIGDQLDDLYHAGVFSADMTAKLKKVKDDNPK